MSVFKSASPLLVVAFFGAFIAVLALAYLGYSIYQFVKELEYEKPFDIEAQVYKTCPKVVEVVKPPATYLSNRVVHSPVSKVLGRHLFKLDNFIPSRGHSAVPTLVADESFTCIYHDGITKPLNERSARPVGADIYCQPRMEGLEAVEEGIPSPFDVYVSSRRPRILKGVWISSPAAASRSIKSPTDVWWLGANVTVKPSDSQGQKPILTNPVGHVRCRSTPVILGDVSNMNTATVPTLLVTPPTPKKVSKWRRRKQDPGMTPSSPCSPVMKSLKAQGRKPPGRRLGLTIPKWSVEGAKGGVQVPVGYF